MIFSLNGILIAKRGLQIVVDVSGVGYGLLAPMSTMLKLPEIGSKIFLHTYLLVREDLQTLYGFIEEREKILFCELIKISGLGGKIALAILSHLTPEKFLQVVYAKDLATLNNVPGIGNKIAQRLMVEMQNNLQNKRFKELFQINSLESLENTDDSCTAAIPNQIATDVQDALISLGYKPKQANLVINNILNQGNFNGSSEQLLKSALKHLSKVYYD